MRESRKEAVSRHKRELILDAARSVFAEEGLEGASLRAIATRARLHAGGAVFPFRFQGSNLCRGAAAIAGLARASRQHGGRDHARRQAEAARRGNGLLPLLC
ncbi:TetR family transcriptional regulator [Bradyrhizobium sp. USDA 4473]